MKCFRTAAALVLMCAGVVAVAVGTSGCGPARSGDGGASASSGGVNREFKSRPNVILIVADDLGYADLGCQNLARDVRTPYIDSLALNGVRMTNGYVPSVVCSPSRAGLLTGRYPQRFGHEFNPGPDTADTFGLPLDQVTLPQALKTVGYTTAMVGKWHLGTRPEQHPQRRGFDEFFGFLGGAHAYDIVGTDRNVLMRGTQPLASTDYLTDAFSREAVEFIDRQARRRAADAGGGAGAGGDAAAASQPFFLYLAYNAVHTPMQAPPHYFARFPDVKDDTRRTMLAMLAAVDDGVGRVLAKVREHGLEEDTLIFFLSDNGAPTRANGSRNTPLRGVKNTAWDGGIKVPFIVQWKGSLPAGKVYEHPVSALDVAPTIFALAGIPTLPRGKYDGVELLPFLAGATAAAAAPPPHDALYWRYGEQWAIRSGNHKLTRADVTAPPRLFDLSHDPGESTDLAARQPELVRELRAKYDRWNATLAPPLWRDVPEARAGERLAELSAPPTPAPTTPARK